MTAVWRPRALRIALAVGAILIAICLYKGLAAGLAAYYYSQARTRLGAGEMSQGVTLLERARSWRPAHRAARFLLARASLADPGDARRQLEELYLSGDRSPEVLDLLGRLHEEAGRTDEARTLFVEACDRYPDRIAGPLGLARLPGKDTSRLHALARPEPGPAGAPVRGLALLHLEDDLGAMGYGTPSCAESLRRARQAGATFLSLRIPGRQADVGDPGITFGQEPPGGERDLEIRRTVRDAHLLGFRVLLKPHIMLERITDDEWRGTIGFDDPARLEAWWSDYQRFILHYARFAAEEEVEMFCVGLELRRLAREHPERWSALIAAVREIYDGQLTYAANWYYEYEEITFWSELDAIGIQFFFPLTDTENPTPEDLRSRLPSLVGSLGDLAFGYQRPVLLTEVGYKSTPGAAQKPWVWPRADDVPAPELQAEAYRAVLEAFTDVPWLRGMFWWNWLTTPVPDEKFLRDFTPQGKPALEVLEEAWKGSG